MSEPTDIYHRVQTTLCEKLAAQGLGFVAFGLFGVAGWEDGRYVAIYRKPELPPRGKVAELVSKMVERPFPNMMACSLALVRVLEQNLVLVESGQAPEQQDIVRAVEATRLALMPKGALN